MLVSTFTSTEANKQTNQGTYPHEDLPDRRRSGSENNGDVTPWISGYDKPAGIMKGELGEDYTGFVNKAWGTYHDFERPGNEVRQGGVHDNVIRRNKYSVRLDRETHDEIIEEGFVKINRRNITRQCDRDHHQHHHSQQNKRRSWGHPIKLIRKVSLKSIGREPREGCFGWVI
ncbi:hypothetical protein CROQUDRAFT_670224 [Cronartium quercuum f. sp. fusiforme G11]|uniref:Uncharacterized protein n=1 Tax=Cronartium quercuum f. sp. fusiforme G11 TaxID=708437 RepID=A0A9P6NL31_9BASI|nr:hypothetical protein CROQUDRAFT_670224 [Cronartium quercuum f. sp. fusiforme G11]